MQVELLLWVEVELKVKGKTGELLTYFQSYNYWETSGK